MGEGRHSPHLAVRWYLMALVTIFIPWARGGKEGRKALGCWVSYQLSEYMSRFSLDSLWASISSCPDTVLYWNYGVFSRAH